MTRRLNGPPGADSPGLTLDGAALNFSGTATFGLGAAAFAAIAASLGGVAPDEPDSAAVISPTGFFLRTSRLIIFFFFSPVSGADSGGAPVGVTIGLPAGDAISVGVGAAVVATGVDF